MAVYHAGEVAVQRRAGVAHKAGISLRAIRDTVPPVAREFLAAQSFLVLGAADPDGRMWSTMLAAAPGFLTVPDESVLDVAARPHPQDPLAEALTQADPHAPLPVGTIALDPRTRRRMRMNGLAVPTPDGLRLTLDEVVANCPRHLQVRQPLAPDAGRPAPAPRPAVDSVALSATQRRTIEAADTFFVATASDRGAADASHRGGDPGFVEVLSPTRLRWPDYVGNAMFLTLGNLALSPAAGLLFPDWDTGTLLHLTGEARTRWAGPAERTVEFEVSAVREVGHAVPLRWSAPEYSRFNPPVPPRRASA
ncbi:pyridoxamine 5'-phosphate oxidase family protein (plasmid) [Streptomyces sp. BI20]|uniref:pyridoxamine 5'-phosphate oxidase family protein n=1 Tax=Streptomyces sp. BI20 TaxID=3403460 RepID=UPI003C76662F